GQRRGLGAHGAPADPDPQADAGRNVESRDLGDPLLREARLSPDRAPGERAAAAPLLEHPRAADRGIGGAHQFGVRVTILKSERAFPGNCYPDPELVLAE